MAPQPSEEYSDDLTIEDGERLYRLITPGQTKYDEDDVAVRPQTNAFQDYPIERLDAAGVPATAVSVFLESAMAEYETSIEDILARRDPSFRYGVAVITAGEARSERQGVVRYPTTSDPEHGMIFCLEGDRKSGGQSKRLARAARVLIAPRRP